MRAPRRQGSALIIALVFMSILTGVAILALGQARDLVQARGWLQDKLQCELEAESAMARLTFALASSQYEESRAVLPAAVQERLPGLPAVLPLGGERLVLGASQVVLWDLAASLPVVHAPAATTARFLRGAGVSRSAAATAAASCLDWFDPDERPVLNGAESAYYRLQEQAAFGPRDAPFPQAIEELGLIRGWGENGLPGAATECLTIVPGVRLNLHTASAPVLAAVLDMALPEAEQLVAIRRQAGGRLSGADVSRVTGQRLEFVPMLYAPGPCRIVEITCVAEIGTAREAVRQIVDLRPSGYAPYTIRRCEL